MDALKKEQEANRKLREYVEQITLRILERNPSILEIAAKPQKWPRYYRQDEQSFSLVPHDVLSSTV